MWAEVSPEGEGARPEGRHGARPRFFMATDQKGLACGQPHPLEWRGPAKLACTEWDPELLLKEACYGSYR